jgi:hypothetical protein
VQVLTFTSLGREWMKRQLKESLGVEVLMLPANTVKRTREELEEATAVLTALEGETLKALQSKLETVPFSKVAAAHVGPQNDTVPEALRAALRTYAPPLMTQLRCLRGVRYMMHARCMMLEGGYIG